MSNKDNLNAESRKTKEKDKMTAGSLGDSQLPLLDEGGEDGPHELVGALLARLRLKVQVQKVPENDFNFFFLSLIRYDFLAIFHLSWDR